MTLRFELRVALIQTYIVFDGTLPSWWTKFVVGFLLFAFIAMQRLLVLFADREARANAASGHWSCTIHSGTLRHEH